MSNDTKPLSLLRKTFHSKGLTLYLGAGVSIGSQVPSWEKLVLLMYFNKISQEKMNGWRPYSNYLYAIAEWYLEEKREPLEITARKLGKYYESLDESTFLRDLYSTLYGNLLSEDHPDPRINKKNLRINNATLDAVAQLCESSKKGVRAVVSYNYDSLLEKSLGTYPYQSVFCPCSLDMKAMPIFHVHGYVPLDRNTKGSKGDGIVFTEDQYHQVAENPYSWSNLVQLQLMSSSPGLMIGLSLSDRNMRRLLDAVRNSPVNSTNFALLKEPDINPPQEEVLDRIHHKAIAYLHDFERSGIKSRQRAGGGIFFPSPGMKTGYPKIKSSRTGLKGPRYQFEISGIIEQVKLIDKEQQEFVLKQLGIIPVWYKDFSDIPKFIDRIIE